ncbi:unnamed protein product [Periconia digitata]|uniref:DUF7703 domain-containing protein n=1 Tax=Periconia digitata TaxID=1303443 RepID=A0A9W4XLJ7_9PLEO|nr:unnamed protein product [Periconia digitata]
MAIAPEDSNIGSDVQVGVTNGLIICAFLSVAWYNVAELTVLIQSFFKRYAGFYYYSLLVATWGIFFHGLGMFLKFYHINEDVKGEDIINTVIVWTGWCMMVTGQSIVLYSRLHLVAQAKWTKYVLWVIIFDAIVLHSTTGVATFLTNTTSTPERWIPLYSVIEKIQVTWFFLQEVMLSGIYIWKTTALLRIEGPLFESRRDARRKVLVHTIVMSAIIIALDIALLGLEFAGLYDIQTSFKGAVYSIKLKMEFTILNQLMNLVRGTLRNTNTSSTGPNSKAHRNTTIITATPSGGVHGAKSSITTTSRFSRHVHVMHGNEAAHHRSIGPYSKMDDDVEEIGADGIRLENLKNGDVLKTTTMEVKVERVGEEDEIQQEPFDRVVNERRVGAGGGGDGRATGLSSRSESAASSEVYVIEMCDKGSGNV